MAQIELKAKVTFYNAGVFTIAGETFKVDKEDAAAYITRGLADPTSGATANQVEAVAGEKAYEDMTVKELRTVAKDLNITGYYQMSKDDLIDVIRQAEVREVETEEPIAEIEAEGATE